MVKAVVTGAAGRMGRRIIDIIHQTDGVKLGGALEYPDHASVGQDSGEIAGIGKNNIIIGSDIAAAMENCDVLIDFTFPEVTMKNLEVVKRLGKSAVIGTTALSQADVKKIRSMSKTFRCLLAPNMSVGVNVMLKLVAQAAQALGDAFDMEIVETHHKMKKDAPSGTAMKLAEVLAETTSRDLNEVGMFERHGMIGARGKNEIGVQTLRGGDVVGDHTTFFFGAGERLEITHRATSRDTFATGAVRGAIWLSDKAPGFYDMSDVLDFKK